MISSSSSRILGRRQWDVSYFGFRFFEYSRIECSNLDAFLGHWVTSGNEEVEQAELEEQVIGTESSLRSD